MGSYNGLCLVLWTVPNPKGTNEIKSLTLEAEWIINLKGVLDCNRKNKRKLKKQTKLEMEFSCFKGRNDRKFILLSPDEDTDTLPFPGTEVPLRKPWRNEAANLCFFEHLLWCDCIVTCVVVAVITVWPSCFRVLGFRREKLSWGAVVGKHTPTSTITEVKSQKVTRILKDMNLFFWAGNREGIKILSISSIR